MEPERRRGGAFSKDFERSTLRATQAGPRRVNRGGNEHRSGRHVKLSSAWAGCIASDAVYISTNMPECAVRAREAAAECPADRQFSILINVIRGAAAELGYEQGACARNAENMQSMHACERRATWRSLHIESDDDGGAHDVKHTRDEAFPVESAKHDEDSCIASPLHSPSRSAERARGETFPRADKANLPERKPKRKESALMRIQAQYPDASTALALWGMQYDDMQKEAAVELVFILRKFGELRPPETRESGAELAKKAGKTIDQVKDLLAITLLREVSAAQSEIEQGSSSAEALSAVQLGELQNRARERIDGRVAAEDQHASSSVWTAACSCLGYFLVRDFPEEQSIIKLWKDDATTSEKDRFEMGMSLAAYLRVKHQQDTTAGAAVYDLYETELLLDDLQMQQPGSEPASEAYVALNPDAPEWFPSWHCVPVLHDVWWAPSEHYYSASPDEGWDEALMLDGDLSQSGQTTPPPNMARVEARHRNPPVPRRIERPFHRSTVTPAGVTRARTSRWSYVSGGSQDESSSLGVRSSDHLPTTITQAFGHAVSSTHDYEHEQAAPTPLDERASVDANGSPRNPGWTPLMSAAKHGHVSIVQLLAQASADMNAADHYGNTPLVLASRDGHDAVVSYLLNAGASTQSVWTRVQQGETPEVEWEHLAAFVAEDTSFFSPRRRRSGAGASATHASGA